MARYPDSLIEEIRERADLLEVIGPYVKLKKNGVNWLGLCPFHNEKTPSFNVRPDKGFFKCFGCGKGGDAFEFLIRIKGIEFFDAIEELAGIAGIPLPELEKESSAQIQEKQLKEKLRERMTSALAFFRQTLKSPRGKLARQYLSDRGLKPETIEKFQLGYAPPGWSNLLDHFKTQEQAVKELEIVGLATSKKDGGNKYDRFRDRIIFPIFDLKGQCVAFGGRILGQGEPKYINSPETPLYHKGDILYGLNKTQEAIQKEEKVLVVEGYMDLIALANHGINNVVATLGTAMTQNHLRLLWRRTQRVLFCFDGDRAGEDAAWRALQMVIDGLQADRSAEFLFLAKGDDPDEVVKREGADGFRALTNKATPLIEFLISRLGNNLNLDGPEGRAALVHRARPLLNKVGDPLLRELYAETIGQRFSIPLHLVGAKSAKPLAVSPPKWGGAKPSTSPRRKPFVRPNRPEQIVSAGRNYEQRLLYLLLRKPSHIVANEDRLGEIKLENPQFATLLTDLIEMDQDQLEKEGFNPVQQLSSLQLMDVAEAILRDEEEVEPESEQDELDGCMITIQIKQTKQELKQAINRFGTNSNKQDSDYLLGLKMDLKRLQLSKIRSVQSN
ncbi:MAG: DNA primase [Magnetococcales bacterium]|nr:DNA primase [Magnetococcales bacterium]